jgi:hypothetical protein
MATSTGSTERLNDTGIHTTGGEGVRVFQTQFGRLQQFWIDATSHFCFRGLKTRRQGIDEALSLLQRLLCALRRLLEFRYARRDCSGRLSTQP